MLPRNVPARPALGGDGFEGGGETDIPGDAIEGRLCIVRAAPAPAGRHAARDRDDGGDTGHAEQPEQARIDGDADLVSADPVADAFHRRA